MKHLFDRDRRKLKVVLLGSASLFLQSGLGESLEGGYEVIRANHWNLKECQRALGWSLDEYLKFGGYPAAGELTADIARWKSFMRDSIIEPVLFKDILGLASVAKSGLNNGLVHAFHNPDDIDTNPQWRGSIFEASVGSGLATVSEGNLYYWRYCPMRKRKRA